MINRNKYAGEFSSSEKAEAFLTQSLADEFAGRKFEIYTREGNTYVFEKDEYNASILSKVNN